MLVVHDRQSAAQLCHREHELGVLHWGHKELRILRIPFEKALFVLVRETSTIGFRPCRFETHTSPILREIDIEEKGAEVVLPIVVVHHERTIVLVRVESLIGRQRLNVIRDVLVIHLSLLALVGPGELPFGLAPWVPEPQESNGLLSTLIVSIGELYDVVDGVGVVQNETTRLTLNHQLSFLTISFDTASHEAIVVISLYQELPEALGTPVVLLDHLVWEHARGLILDKDLFGLHAGELLHALVDVARDQVLITTMKFSVCLFDQGNPKLVRVLATAKHRLSFLLAFFCVHRDALVNDNIDPLEVLEDPDYIEANRAVLVEDGWIHSI